MSPFIECPRCGQGSVTAVRVRLTAEIVQVCEECDALWLAEEDPSAAEFTTLDAFMAARGRPAVWSELEEIDWP